MDYSPFEAQYSLGERVCRYLAGQMDDQGCLYDAVDGTQSPPKHYALTFLAWACLNIGDSGSASRALEGFFSDPGIGWLHADFNTYALAHIAFHGKRDTLPESILSRVDDYLQYPPFRSTPGANISNNWLAMHAAALAVLGRRMDRPEWTARAKRLINGYALKWQTADGLFVDYPLRPGMGRGRFSTPLTYHTKICAMLLRYGMESGDRQAYAAAGRGMEALDSLVFSGGDAFQFGRTNMGLFGYASALYALSILIKSTPGDSSRWAGLHNRLIRKLWDMSNPAGYIELTPAGGGNLRSGWDEYMHLTVYNAYFTALATAFHGEDEKTLILAESDTGGIDLLPDSGLARVRSGETEALVSLAGNCMTGQGYLFCDNRYAGFNICHLVSDGVTLVSPPALFGKGDANPFDPSSLAFHPWFRIKERSFQFRFFHEVRQDVLNEGRSLLAMGRSRPVEIGFISWPDQSFLRRAFWKVLRTAAGLSRPEVSVENASGGTLERFMLVERNPFFVIFIDRIGYPAGASSIYPTGISCPEGSWRIDDRGIAVEGIGSQSWHYLFQPRLPGDSLVSRVLTSTGSHDIVHLPGIAGNGARWQVSMLVRSCDEPDGIDLRAEGDDFHVTVRWRDSVTEVRGSAGRSLRADLSGS